MTPVVIVGGGPVGLLLGCLLAQRGIACIVLEQRPERSPHSRAIGLHAPALALLDRVGVGQAARERAVAISGGQVFYESKHQGRLALEPGSVSLPQTETEQLLEERLCSLPCASLQRGVTVASLRDFQGSLVVGCDGKDSTVRVAAGIKLIERPLPDHYLMGDFTDNTTFGTDAALFFSRYGVVESFPMPGALRRWVAWVPSAESHPSAVLLRELIQARTGHSLPTETCDRVSAFGVQHQRAQHLIGENIALVGDAAQVISPIGGQGLTLGFLGASALADAIVAGNLRSYARSQPPLAQLLGRRAIANTILGRPCRRSAPHLLLVRALRHVPPLTHHLARHFTLTDASVARFAR